MFKCCIQSSWLFLSVISLVSCSSANNKPLPVGFSQDSSSIVFRDIDPAGLLQVKNIPHIDTVYSAFISVSQTPSENDSIGVEQSMPGKVTVTDSTIIFFPSKSFVKGQSYEVISYLNAKFSSPAMIFSGKLNHSVKPQHIILVR